MARGIVANLTPLKEKQNKMTDFRIKTLRCEWLVVIQQVDQYGASAHGQRSILARWPTADEAYNTCPIMVLNTNT